MLIIFLYNTNKNKKMIEFTTLRCNNDIMYFRWCDWDAAWRVCQYGAHSHKGSHRIEGYQEKNKISTQKCKIWWFGIFLELPNFVLMQNLELQFFEEMAISLSKGDHNVNKKLQPQILHQNKIRELQKTSKSSNFTFFDMKFIFGILLWSNTSHFKSSYRPGRPPGFRAL